MSLCRQISVIGVCAVLFSFAFPRHSRMAAALVLFGNILVFGAFGVNLGRRYAAWKKQPPS